MGIFYFPFDVFPLFCYIYFIRRSTSIVANGRRNTTDKVRRNAYGNQQWCYPWLQWHHDSLSSAGSASYGYEISRQIKTLSHEKYIIKETTLYSAFTRMEKNGYITSFQDQNTATGKRRTYYQITGKGRAYYQEKCEEWLLTQEVVEQFIRKGETENGSY